MIINSPIVTNLKITKLEDLHKLKPLMESTNFKINKSVVRQIKCLWISQINQGGFSTMRALSAI